MSDEEAQKYAGGMEVAAPVVAGIAAGMPKGPGTSSPKTVPHDFVGPLEPGTVRLPAPGTARIPGGPFKDFPEWGRGSVKWGTGADDAIARAGEITAEEAKQLDPAKVQAAKDFYEAIFNENQANAAAQARAQLMEKILRLQGGK